MTFLFVMDVGFGSTAVVFHVVEAQPVMRSTRRLPQEAGRELFLRGEKKLALALCVHIVNEGVIFLCAGMTV